MRRLGRAIVLAAASAAAPAAAQDRDAAIDRGLGFLTREVAAWTAEKHCLSCHNQGDGVRALAAAVRAGRLDSAALAEPTASLVKVEEWTAGGAEATAADPPFVDTRLAAIQFSAALVALGRAGAEVPEGAQANAAEKVAGEQDAGGGWRVDAGALGGSPITYGDALATATARDALASIAAEEYSARIDAADAWLRRQGPRRVVDLAGVLLGLGDGEDQEAKQLRALCSERLLAAQVSHGGWGAFADRPPEVFDTAIAMIALAGDASPAAREAVARGAAWLIDQQYDDGAWPETTRPPGVESYAHAVSTTAWAVQALLATDAARR